MRFYATAKPAFAGWSDASPTVQTSGDSGSPPRVGEGLGEGSVPRQQGEIRFAELFRFFDVGRVAAVRHHYLSIAPTIGGVAVEDGAHLRHHRLRGEDLLTR